MTWIHHATEIRSPSSATLRAAAVDQFRRRLINPLELGIAQKMVTRMSHAKFDLIPIPDATRGHGTHTEAAVWKDYLVAFLRETEKK